MGRRGFHEYVADNGEIYHEEDIFFCGSGNV